MKSRNRHFKKSRGFVSIVGAGPGNPELMTLGGKKALEAADVVIYDSLVYHRLLDYALQARKILVGKQSGNPDSVSQESIQSLLVQLARAGKRVVRLKGGDPFIFGRGGEEALYLTDHQIPFEILPGITAATGTAAYCGIPLTRRGMASDVILITAHESPTKAKHSEVNWEAVSALTGTVVLYMGVQMLPEIVDIFIQNGKDQATLVSVIEWGTTSEQKRVNGKLGTIVEKVRKADLKSPAITIIGCVNKISDKINWFEKRPLFGKTIVTTRAENQSARLTEALEAQGAHVLELPTIQISKMKSCKQLDNVIKRLDRFDWLVFTSENGVDAFFERLEKLGKDARSLRNIKVAVIGPGTRAKLNAHSIRSDLMPTTFTAKGLFEALKRKKALKNNRFLLLRADIAPVYLNQELKRDGAYVTEVPVYRTRCPRGLSGQIRKWFWTYSVDYITFTSASTAKHFFKASPKDINIKAKNISIGPMTSQAITEMGQSIEKEAKEHTISGVVEAILEAEKKLEKRKLKQVSPIKESKSVSEKVVSYAIS